MRTEGQWSWDHAGYTYRRLFLNPHNFSEKWLSICSTSNLKIIAYLPSDMMCINGDYNQTQRLVSYNVKFLKDFRNLMRMSRVQTPNMTWPTCPISHDDHVPSPLFRSARLINLWFCAQPRRRAFFRAWSPELLETEPLPQQMNFPTKVPVG